MTTKVSWYQEYAKLESQQQNQIGGLDESHKKDLFMWTMFAIK